MANIYSTLRWRAARARALARDGNRCVVARWLGGDCAPPPFHVHHIQPVTEGGALYDLDNLGTACARHHPQWEALRRRILREARGERVVCRHQHRTAEGRRLCEERLNRRSVAA